MARISDRLKDRLNGVRTNPIGLSADDLRKLQVTPDLVEDVLSALDSPDIVDQQIALFFADVLFAGSKIGSVYESKFVVRIVQLGGEQGSRARSAALKLVARYHDRVPDFRSLMLEALKSDDPVTRKQALLAYPLYCLPKEVVPLESFEDDPYVIESAMGGPLTYELRNLALETIERVIPKSFRKLEKTEALPTGEIAFWWDWAPYHSWKNGFLRRLFRG